MHGLTDPGQGPKSGTCWIHICLDVMLGTAYMNMVQIQVESDPIHDTLSAKRGWIRH